MGMIHEPRAGLRVRMTTAYKTSPAPDEHVAEFGDCVGIMLGPVFDDPMLEWDVRWQPSGLRYGYALQDLEEAAE